MSDLNFENHLHDTLAEYRSELNTGELWDKLEPALAKDKKRRRALFWWLSAGVLLALVAGGAGAWFYTQQPATSVEAAKPLIQASSSQMPTSVEEICNEPSLPARTNENQYSKSTTHTAAVRHTALAKTEDVFYDENKPQVRILQQNTPTEHVEAPLAVSVEVTRADHTDVGTIFPAQTTSVVDIPLVATLDASVQNGSKPASGKLSLPDQSTPGRKRQYPFMLRVEAEAGKPYKILVDPSADSIDVAAYIQNRKNTEKTLEYAGASVAFGFKHRSGFYALGGLSYTRINERFYTSSERVEQDSIADGIVEIYIDSNGDSTFVMGNVEVTRYISYRKRTYNHYTLLDLPVIAGYSLQNGKWSLGLEGGVFVNLSLKTTGDILDENGAVIDLAETPVFKKSIGFSYYGSLRLGYDISERLQLSVAPSLRVFPKSFTPDDQLVIQKYTLASLKAGLMYRF